MSFILFYLSEILVKTNIRQMWILSKKIIQLWYVITSTSVIFVWLKCVMWRTPNSLKDSNVSPSERQRKKEESGCAP
jgi:hypothetical protein